MTFAAGSARTTGRRLRAARRCRLPFGRIILDHLNGLLCYPVPHGICHRGRSVAIVVTDRYPRGIFEFNAGVLRWTWRGLLAAYTTLSLFGEG